jgi:hypothetical protein
VSVGRTTTARAPVEIRAPFARGEPFGGSQRLTAIAERLEDLGVESVWRVTPAAASSVARRLVNLAAGQPDEVARYRRGEARAPAGANVIFGHSYVAPRRPEAQGAAFVDWQNVEWHTLRDVARLVRGPRRSYVHLQARLMRRHERALVRNPRLFHLMATESELAWAVTQGAAEQNLILCPNQLPRASVREAEAIRAARPGAPRTHLVYIGRLIHRPNHLPLERFLEEQWAGLRRARPDARLQIAGKVAPEVAARLGRHDGVEVLGFVEDLTSTLAGASAAILPFETRGGSSLRVLYCALAGIPVVGPSAAFRGFPTGLGVVVREPDDWVAGLSALLGADGEADARTALARRHQADDSAYGAIAERLA